VGTPMRLLSFAMRLIAASSLVCAGITAAATPAAAQPSPAAAQRNLAGKTEDLIFQTKDLTFTVDDLAGKTKDLEVKETKTEIHINLAADVLFDFDKSTLRPSARDALHQAAAIIRDNAKGSTVRIDGYTDSKGSDPYNQRLSDRRAESVRNWFVTKEGLKDVSFATKGYGAKNPVAPNTKPDGSDDPDGRQKNRRVEITVKKS
jgi:outer membrane protein OmpA-like peptidoglycan-associated protein